MFRSKVTECRMGRLYGFEFMCYLSLLDMAGLPLSVLQTASCWRLAVSSES